MYEAVLKEKEGVAGRLASVEGEVRRVKEQLVAEQTTSAAAAKVREGRGEEAKGGGGGELEGMIKSCVFNLYSSVSL